MEALGLPDWLIWGLIAVALLAVEMMTVTYIALGFAAGAVVAGLLSFLFPGMHVFVQALIWALVGAAVWLGIARWNAAFRKTHRDINDFDPLDSLPESDRRRRAPSRDKGNEK